MLALITEINGTETWSENTDLPFQNIVVVLNGFSTTTTPRASENTDCDPRVVAREYRFELFGVTQKA